MIRLANEAGLVYQRHPLAEERLRSAVALVKALLQMPGLIQEHRREFLKLALWKVTEAEGRTKYKTQFRSRGRFRALLVPNSNTTMCFRDR